MITRLVDLTVLQGTSSALAVVLSLACGNGPTLQVLYGGNVPVNGLTVELTHGGQTTVVRGTSFTTTNALGTPHSIPIELGTGPAQVLIQLTDAGSVLVAEGSFTFDATGGGTKYVTELSFVSRRPLCPEGCGFIAFFPSLVPGSSDTLFVSLGTWP
jgi:hypothetical protein